MLALGMGTGVAIFAFVDAALLKPLPYDNPSRLVGVFESVRMFPRSNLSYPDYLDWKKLNTVFESLDIYQRAGFLLTTPSGAQPVRGTHVSDGFFRTLEAKLLRGRYFNEAEDASKPRVAIINQAFARQYFPGEDALGMQLSYLTTSPVPIAIVGIVEDIREGPLDAAIPPVLYIPFNQSTDSYLGVVVRTTQAERSLLLALAGIVKEIDPDIVTIRGMTMTDRIHNSPSAYLHRSSAWLVGGFAALALLMGLVGLYGVVAYSVGRRTREIGVRMALGARRRSIYQLILKEAGWLTAIGILTGLVCSVVAATLMHGLLFGVDSWDVPTLVVVAGGLGVAALLASYLPARRAASVNPVEALRAE